MVVVFASTGGVTGAEVGIAGGSAVVGQKLLEAVFGDQAVRRLALNARKDLEVRVQALMDEERQRFIERLDALELPTDSSEQLRAAGPQGRRPALRPGAERFVSGLVAGARRRCLGRGAPLDARVDGLEQAVEAGRGRLDDAVLGPAAAVVERAGARLRLSAEHTVVALAGATGSGKSSTFNALVGLDLAAVGVRRPTTSWATACIWGTEAAAELLDWLGIPDRAPGAARLDARPWPRQDKALDGLVLLDLPDHDSTEVSHHLEVDRLVGMTDLMVWVLDPQKYADAAIHDRFLKPLATHKDVMLVVLNHIDEVPEDRRSTMLDDVRRLLDARRAGRCPGARHLRPDRRGHRRSCGKAISKRVADKASMRTRLAGDISDAAARMTAHSGDAEPRELGDQGPARAGRGAHRTRRESRSSSTPYAGPPRSGRAAPPAGR